MNGPTLNPFPTRSDSGVSAGSLVLAALILGIATAAALLYFRWPSIVQKGEDASVSLSSIFSEPRTGIARDWTFYTAEIDTVMQELRTAKNNYELKSKDLISTQLRLEAEKEDLARLRRDLELMRRQFSESVAEFAASKSTAPKAAPTQKP